MVVPEADPVELAAHFFEVPEPSRIRETSGESFQIGKLSPFWITNTSTQQKYAIYARLAAVGRHAYFWIDTGVAHQPEHVQQLLDTFDRQIYPRTREIFGSEWSPGVDGDERIHILYASGMGSGVAGYFSSVDEYTTEVFDYSNGREMFYLNADTIDLNSEFTTGVLAHEFVHMILWNVDTNEQTWMNEGFAEIGAALNGYSVGGVDLAYLNDPDLALTYWPTGASSKAASYGQAYLFLSYFMDRFGLQSVKDLFQLESNGLQSMDELFREFPEFSDALDSPHPADEVYRDWSVALLLQDAEVLDGRYSYKTAMDREPQVYATEMLRDCPLGPIHQQVSQYGIDYIQIQCEGDFRLIFDGMDSIPVLPADPVSGEYAMWSNRGDESKMTLSRAFDLSGSEGPVTLSYWTWYDIEVDYDYLYVQVSDDGGETWDLLQTPSGIAYDPNGNSYGWAYNGSSGGGEEPVWIQEVLDLTPYRGREIQLRFDYITDAAVNGEGFLLDEVEIDAIGYQEGFENGLGGWQAEGFVRLYNQVPQTFQVVLIEGDGNGRVQPIRLDENQRAEIPVSFDGELGELTLIVIGTSRYSWQPASYEFSLVQTE
jgi:hypothetical protein